MGFDHSSCHRNHQNQPNNVGLLRSPSRMKNRDESGEHNEGPNQQPSRSEAEHLRQGEMNTYDTCQREKNRPARLDISSSVRHESDHTASASTWHVTPARQEKSLRHTLNRQNHCDE